MFFGYPWYARMLTTHGRVRCVSLFLSTLRSTWVDGETKCAPVWEQWWDSTAQSRPCLRCGTIAFGHTDRAFETAVHTLQIPDQTLISHIGNIRSQSHTYRKYQDPNLSYRKYQIPISHIEQIRSQFHTPGADSATQVCTGMLRLAVA